MLKYGLKAPYFHSWYNPINKIIRKKIDIDVHAFLISILSQWNLSSIFCCFTLHTREILRNVGYIMIVRTNDLAFTKLCCFFVIFPGTFLWLKMTKRIMMIDAIVQVLVVRLKFAVVSNQTVGTDTLLSIITLSELYMYMTSGITPPGICSL